MDDMEEYTVNDDLRVCGLPVDDDDDDLTTGAETLIGATLLPNNASAPAVRSSSSSAGRPHALRSSLTVYSSMSSITMTSGCSPPSHQPSAAPFLNGRRPRVHETCTRDKTEMKDEG